MVGYSWKDTHVNDLLIDAIARGSVLVNVSKDALQEQPLALFKQKFSEGWAGVSKRIYMFGGGTKTIFERAKVQLCNQQTIAFDLFSGLEQGLPEELSMAKTLPPR